ncbi:MAG: DUF58 domain-containing protein [Bifidobacteriaceae bacterium]|jgi:uncharacterized protein (DUF58 family)|nr:DUF58 domain-containing protein [Bifidobacteriaceae bacterium]
MTYSAKSKYHRNLNLPLVRRAYLSLTGRHPSIFKGSGLDFDELREYIPGDQPQSVDWKSSAKRGSLVVKDFESSTITNSVILSDSSRFMYAKGSSDESLIDIATFASSLISYLSVNRGDKTTILYSDDKRLVHEKTGTTQFSLHYPLDRLNASASASAPVSDISKAMNYILQFWQKRVNLTIVASLPALVQMNEKTLAKIAKRNDTLVIGLKSKNPYNYSTKEQEFDILNHSRVPAFLKSRAAYRKYENFLLEQSEKVSSLLKSKGVYYIESDSIDGLFHKFVKYIEASKWR